MAIDREPSPEERLQALLFNRDQMRESAEPLARGVAEPQAAKYEMTMYRLLQRTNNNPEIANAFNKLLRALDISSRFGNSDEPMPKGHINSLTEVIKEATERIRLTE